jgi:hypothetical protein
MGSTFPRPDRQIVQSGLLHHCAGHSRSYYRIAARPPNDRSGSSLGCGAQFRLLAIVVTVHCNNARNEHAGQQGVGAAAPGRHVPCLCTAGCAAPSNKSELDYCNRKKYVLGSFPTARLRHLLGLPAAPPVGACRPPQLPRIAPEIVEQNAYSPAPPPETVEHWSGWLRPTLRAAAAAVRAAKMASLLAPPPQ